MLRLGERGEGSKRRCHVFGELPSNRPRYLYGSTLFRPTRREHVDSVKSSVECGAAMHEEALLLCVAILTTHLRMAPITGSDG